MSYSKLIRIFLSGDVMTGRGIDQILPHPGNPLLQEASTRDARRYVALAEVTNGPIERPATFDYIWGDALDELDQAETDLRIINLETSVTSSDDFWPAKEVHYRMHPPNIGCLTAARIDCCCLANNHLLDLGFTGLEETLQTLDLAGVAHAGAGKNLAAAAAPVAIDVPRKGRVLVFSFGSTSSGIPSEWGATSVRPGVNLLKNLSEGTIRDLTNPLRRLKQPGDVVVASIHWGSNWGYQVPEEHVSFAHRLIDEGVDIVHGHSSHHVRTIEVYRDRLILYGCGDLLNDYEGIGGYEKFRSHLALMYLATVDPGQGRLVEARLVPMQIRRFQLRQASDADAKWLCDLVSNLGAPSGTRAQLESDNRLSLRWA